MALITGSPFRFTDGTIRIGTDNYEALVSAAELVPTTTSSTFKAINGDSHTKSGKASYTLNLSFAQDWENDDSLSNYLFENEGTVVEAELRPASGGKGFAVEVELAAPNIGGTADTDAVSTVAMGCQGKPTILPAA
ncbi:hypothetical protein [Marisediminicola sp. LYQ85]|uniref:hypothetical protein n=1 Tax=Marisediminicola sp. LYQ85 TaxID=3391062 RepID=UPI00398325BD